MTQSVDFKMVSRTGKKKVTRKPNMGKVACHKANLKKHSVNNNQPIIRQPQDIFFDQLNNSRHYFKSSNIICFEFSLSEIRLMHLVKVDMKYRIKHCEELPLNNAVGVDSETVTEAIRIFYNSCKTKSLKVVLVLGGPQILVKTIKIPSLRKDQIREAVYWKLKQEIPSFSKNDLWDFQPNGSVFEENQKWLNVLAVVARENYVGKYLDILHKIQISPQKVIVKPVAYNQLLHALMYNGIYTKRNIVLIAIEREATLLCFFKSGKLTFSKTLAVGSSTIDKKLYMPVVNGRKKVQIKAQKIELFKRKYGIVKDLLQNPGQSIFPLSQLQDRMIPELKKYVYEIRRSIQFYSNSYFGGKTDLAFITGQGAKLKNLNVYLMNELGIEVCSIRANTQHYNNNFYPAEEFTACFGAALHKGRKFNLIPHRIRKLKKYKYWQKALLMYSILLFSILAFLSFEISATLDDYGVKHDQKKTEFTKALALENTYKGMLHNKKNLEMFSFKINKVLHKQSELEYNLHVLSSLVPDNIVLKSLDFKESASSQYYGRDKEEDGLMIIKGLVVNTNFSADLLLIQFISALQDLSYYTSIELIEKSKNETDHSLNFTLKMELP